MGDGERLKASQLLALAAEQQGQTAAEYCAKVREPEAWGGGPEIVALANALRRPIYVYELLWGVATGESSGESSSSSEEQDREEQPPRFCLRCIAEFGSPRFDRRHAPLHILSCDSRFPNLVPEQMLDQGNHFLLLFECEPDETQRAASESGFSEAFALSLAHDARRRRDRRLRDLRDAEKQRLGSSSSSSESRFVRDLSLARAFVATGDRRVSLRGLVGFTLKRLAPALLITAAAAAPFFFSSERARLYDLLSDFFHRRVRTAFSVQKRRRRRDTDEDLPPSNGTTASDLEASETTTTGRDDADAEEEPEEEEEEDHQESIEPTDTEPPSASNSTPHSPFLRLRRRSPFHKDAA
mmetsp:Transcript_6496/g.20280  ORF Transcript_6496/g.20280 Transcript_6496/m.20280 type:complete len:355 (-) Transcript_6496:179-1243(-)